MSDQQKSLKQIMDFRLEKLNQLINNGINPYPVKFNSTHLSFEIIASPICDVDTSFLPLDKISFVLKPSSRTFWTA